MVDMLSLEIGAGDS